MTLPYPQPDELTKVREYDRLYRMQQCAFNITQLAFARRDIDTFNRAREVHRRLVHKWKMAQAKLRQLHQ